MFNTRDVLRIADRWFDDSHPDSFDKQSRLQSCIVLVLLFHVIMSIAFMKVEEWERTHSPRRVVSSDYAFEFMIAPAELKHPNFSKVPTPLTLIPSRENNTGGERGAQQGKEKESAILLSHRKSDNQVDKVAVALNTVQEKLVHTQPAKDSFEQMQRNTAHEDASISEGKVATPIADPSILGVDHGGNGREEFGGGSSNGDDGTLAGDGANDEAPGSEPVSETNNGIEVGDIHLYHQDVLVRIADNWEPPSKKAVKIVVLVDIARDGSLVSAQLKESCGNRKADRDALVAVQRTTFDPLPSWVRSSHLRFLVALKNFE